MEKPSERQPGDLILDRILPDADEETRERAREALAKYALALYRLGDRIERAKGADDSPKSGGRPIL
jgi:hypothetical protein